MWALVGAAAGVGLGVGFAGARGQYWAVRVICAAGFVAGAVGLLLVALFGGGGVDGVGCISRGGAGVRGGIGVGWVAVADGLGQGAAGIGGRGWGCCHGADCRRGGVGAVAR